MALNADGLELAATALITNLVWAQLHSASAGVDGGDNICSLTRQAVHWDTPDGGDFGMSGAIRFTGGTPNGTVYSVSLWDTEEVDTGTFYGEYPLTGDLTFNGQGEFQVTAIDFTGTSIDGS